MQEEVLALCRKLAMLDANTVWLFFVIYIPAAERWAAKPPRSCERICISSFLRSQLQQPTEVSGAARHVLEAVHTVDSSEANLALEKLGTLV